MEHPAEQELHGSPSSPGSLFSNSTRPTPEPSAPSSRKRSTSDDNERPRSEEPAPKRKRIAESSPESLPLSDVAGAAVDTNPGFNKEQWQLLQRSVALVLDYVGFDSASMEALESFCAEAESYAMNFLSHVTESMLASRRPQPIPLDFEYALRREGLTERLLRPHLKPPISPSKTLLQFELYGPQEATQSHFEVLLGEELSGASEKNMKPYIPKQFPDFPSKHTYKSTSVVPERERDPRKIREKATETARHGEEALRRLVNVGKSGDNRGVKKASEKNLKHKQKHVVWEKTMESLAATRVDNMIPRKSGEEEQQSILVDAGKQYRRKAAAGVSG